MTIVLKVSDRDCLMMNPMDNDSFLSTLLERKRELDQPWGTVNGGAIIGLLRLFINWMNETEGSNMASDTRAFVLASYVHRLLAINKGAVVTEKQLSKMIDATIDTFSYKKPDVSKVGIGQLIARLIRLIAFQDEVLATDAYALYVEDFSDNCQVYQ